MLYIIANLEEIFLILKIRIEKKNHIKTINKGNV